ncbi:tryptophan synthase, beta subunit [Exophiala spinifera]|uniref:Tryptophan synthase n=1 Tax=Exophiala spinifera TaxID=91928 RepID=A0A0D2AT76_9EURO|nr:tryptophan synthase, beta subunit [Exophiala spinifera]KIW09725.1 tryptophan synthase, beta subunit [Exophiala spinifera]
MPYLESDESNLNENRTGEASGRFGRFGQFGGQYVPEALKESLIELDEAFVQATKDPDFWKEWRNLSPYMGRPSPLYHANRLSQHVGGAQIYLKREDLNHTGSSAINNALGQALLARRLGKRRVITQTGSGQHGVAMAAICSKLTLECTVYMGVTDARRQSVNVVDMKILGAEVVVVGRCAGALRDAMNEALRASIHDLDRSFYATGSSIGPHPYPIMVRTFQSLIGQETKDQMKDLIGRLPCAVVACVGASNCVGMFFPFRSDSDVNLIGVEAAGHGIDTNKHSAALGNGAVGVYHGTMTYLMQDEHGQINTSSSIAAGLNCPAVGPELAHWKDSARASFVTVTDAQALVAFQTIAQLEGILPSLETSHAIWAGMKMASTMKLEETLVICLDGKGDKDLEIVADRLRY